MEGATDRALLMCERLKRRVPEELPGLDVHGGVASGRVLVLPEGGMRFVGEPMNLAARLEEHSRAGEFLVDRRTWERSRDAFEFRFLKRLDLPGLGVQEAYLLRGILEGQDLPGGSRSVFVGRGQELLDLYNAWEQFRAQPRPTMVRILGDTGIGKTQFIAEFLSWIPRDQVIIARALPYGMPPYGPLLYALWHLLVDGRSDAYTSLYRSVPVILAALEEDAQKFLPRDPEEAEGVLVQTFSQFLREPRVMVLDDAQWADAGTFRVLRKFFQNEFPVFQIVSGRTPLEDTLHWKEELSRLEREIPATTIRLGPLTREELREWWQRTWQETPDPGVIEEIHHRTRGVPFFARELMHFVREESLEHQNVPPRVEEVLLSRLSALPPETREILDCASVMGPFVIPEAVRHALKLGEEAFEARFAPLVRAKLLEKRSLFPSSAGTPWQEYAFPTPLFHQTVLDSLPRDRKIAYARGLLDFFVHAEFPGLSRNHFVIRLALQAGEFSTAEKLIPPVLQKLTQMGAWQAILNLVREMEPHRSHLSEEVGLRMDLAHARALIRTGRIQKAIGLLERRVETWPSLEATLLLAEALVWKGELQRAEDMLRQAKPRSPDEEWEWFMMKVWVAYRRGKWDEVKALWKKMENLPDPEDPRLHARMLNLKANTLPPHDLRLKIRTYQKALEIAEASGMVSMVQNIHSNLVILASRGYIGETLEHLEKAIALARERGDFLAESVATYNLSSVLVSVGAFDLARKRMEGFPELARRVQNQMGYVFWYEIQGRIAMGMGREEEALRAFREALRWAWRLRSPGLRAEIMDVFAHFLLENGRRAGIQLARWTWDRWPPHRRIFFLWRWNLADVRAEDVLRACPPHLAWDEWLDILVEILQREPRLAPRLEWKVRNILRFVCAHTPATLRPALLEHPRWRDFTGDALLERSI